MAIENEGSEISADSLGSSSMSSARGRGGLNVDRGALRSLTEGIKGLGTELKNAHQYAKDLVGTLGKLGGSSGGGTFGGSFGGGSSKISVPMAGSANSPASAVSGRFMSRFGGGGGGVPGGAGPGSTGGGGGGGGGIFSSALNLAKTSLQPLADLNNYMNQRIAQGAEYSLQADRMSVQLQQMYGMSNEQVRNQLRMPLTTHYLLGGGTAINDLLQMQATTGLTAKTQASTVEALRTVSGFSYGSGDITRMLSSMASPDVANRMFMMGGTGMYGIGGKERTGMQTIQDIVRRTGLTNPEALKGALQQGSNTRQRLTAMGVPQDMQDMVIQYAMQNQQYQKKTGGTAMYDPSLEAERKTMGIEESYAVQHEKTTGERTKREERFYGRQTDNFARFEKNLRLSTQMLAAFEDQLSSIVGLKISTKGHPLTNAATYGMRQGAAQLNAIAQVADSATDLAAGAMIPGGDAIDGVNNSPTPSTSSGTSSNGAKLPADTEKKLAQLKPELAIPLRRMLEERPDIKLHDTVRSTAQQEKSFRERYQPTNKTQKTEDTDREWNGVIWEMKESARKSGAAAMAPPGQSNHEIGLAADINQEINPEHKQWVLNNASRFGLQTGATGKGGPGDEWFHIEAKSSGGGRRKKTTGNVVSSRAASGTVSSARVKAYGRTAQTSTKETPSVMSPNAGAISAQLSQQANARYSSLANPYQSSYGVSTGGDPVDGMNMSSGVSGGGGMSITVSPTIYLTGGQNMSGDMRRIAQEVGKLLEDEVKLRLMRRT